MSSIAGIVSEDDEDASSLVLRMLSRMEHKESDDYGLIVGRNIQKAPSLDDLKTSVKGNMTMGYVGSHTQQPFEDRKQELILLKTGKIYNHKKLKEELKGHDLATGTDSETVIHLIKEFYDGDLASAVAKAIKHLDGEYALAVSDGKEIVIARDALGVRQLYIGEKDEYIAFASERKALWEAGIYNEKRLPPGHVAKLSENGVVLEKVLEIPLNQKTSIFDLSEAVKRYQEALVEAVKKRVAGLDKVGIVFSGGIDSVLVAKVASEFTDVVCYTAGLKGSEDIKHAKLAASKLGLKIKVKELDADDIEKYIPEIMEAIEDRLFVQVEAAIPVYAAVEMAREDGMKVMLTGQGPDELFGGYPWYRKIVEKDGYEVLEHYMREDIKNAYRETLERENKIGMAHGIELRYPFLDSKVIKVAMQIDSRLKVRSSDDKLGKYVHREAAKRLGVPVKLADRPKEAAQHGSGVHDVLLELAEKNGFTEDLVDKTDYDPENSIREKLGSSVRYGHKYGDRKLWEMPAHLQLYLDTIAVKKKLVQDSELSYVESLLASA